MSKFISNEIKSIMKVCFGIVVLCMMWTSQSLAQCEFQDNEFDEENEIMYIHTEAKNIYTGESQLTNLDFSFGNIGTDYYFITLIPEFDEDWEVKEDDGVTFKFSNKRLIYVGFGSFVSSNEDYKVVGPYDRKSKQIRYELSDAQLSEFIRSEVVEIYFRYNDKGISIPIDKSFKSMHSEMFDCLYGRVEGYRMKYPKMSYNKYLHSQEKQNESKTADPLSIDTIVYKVVEKMPRFPGCELEPGRNDKDKEACAKNKMLKYVYSNLKYPEEAVNHKIEGMNAVQFVVNENGSVSDIAVVKDIGYGCGEESKRIIESMNEMEDKWKPGEQRGKPVKVLYTLIIRFKIKP